jgi:hypothetical protein
MERSENNIQPYRIFQGRLWLKEGCFATDDEDEIY